MKWFPDTRAHTHTHNTERVLFSSFFLWEKVAVEANRMMQEASTTNYSLKELEWEIIESISIKMCTKYPDAPFLTSWL